MEITIYAGGIPFNGKTIPSGQSLGGSETAAYYLAAALAARGHEVCVYTSSTEEGVWDGVEYRFHGAQTDAAPLGERFQFWTSHVPCDLLILQRAPGYAAFATAAKVNFWWLHDLALKPLTPAAVSGVWQIDRILSVSEWHSEQIARTWYDEGGEDVPSALPWITALRNAVDPVLYRRPLEQVRYAANKMLSGARRGDYSVLWCSRPERGLENLLKIAERCAEEAPNVRFYLCGYASQLAPDHPVMPLYARLEQKVLSLPNVVQVGTLGKTQLADLQRSCDAWVYPTTFEETSCITAMEAQAAGMTCVTTDAGALPETMGGYTNWLCVPLENGEVNIDKFVAFLKDPCETERGCARVVNTWDNAASEVEFLYRSIVQQINPVDLLTDRLRHNDVRFLRWLVETLPDRGVEIPEGVYLEGVNKELERYRKHDKPELMQEYYQEVWDKFQTKAQWWAVDTTPSTARFMAVKRYLLWKFERVEGQRLRVLDYGCAYGQYGVTLATEHPEHDFVLYDFLPGMRDAARAEIAKRGLENCEVLDEPPPDDQKFDVVLLDELIEHVWDCESFVQEIGQRYGHPDTLFIGSTPFGNWEYGSRGRYGDYKFHVHHFERADLVEMLGQSRAFDTTYTVASQRLGNYVFRWEGLPRVQRIDYDRKLGDTRPRQSVSLCVIAKNAAGKIEHMIKSVAQSVDEVLVSLDETSDKDDETYDRVAKACWEAQIPFQVFGSQSPLEIGFDEARNRSMAPARGSWILWLDCDETAVEFSGMEYFLRDNMWDAYACRQNHLSESPPGLLTTDLPTRMFRRASGEKFFGRVHEHPEKGLNVGVGRGWLVPLFSITHIGYSTEGVRRARFERNWPLMQRDRVDYPDRKLGRWLWVRDLAHVNRYEYEANGGNITDAMRARAREAIGEWEKVVADGILRYAVESLQYYSAHVALLGGGFDANVRSEAHGQIHEFRGKFLTREHYQSLLDLITKAQLDTWEPPQFPAPDAKTGQLLGVAPKE